MVYFSLTNQTTEMQIFNLQKFFFVGAQRVLIFPYFLKKTEHLLKFKSSYNNTESDVNCLIIEQVNKIVRQIVHINRVFPCEDAFCRILQNSIECGK